MSLCKILHQGSEESSEAQSRAKHNSVSQDSEMSPRTLSIPTGLLSPCHPLSPHYSYYLYWNYYNQFYPTMYPQWCQLSQDAQNPPILPSSLSFNLLWLCYILFYCIILYISTCSKDLGLCLLEFRSVHYQWPLCNFRLFIEVSLHLFDPTEVHLSWKHCSPYLSLQSYENVLSPQILTLMCQFRAHVLFVPPW